METTKNGQVFTFNSAQETSVALYLFDLDHTLIEADSDYEWNRFIHAAGWTPPDFIQRNQFFTEQYAQGVLNIQDYLQFAVKPLTQRPLDQSRALLKEFVDQIIRPKIRSQGLEAVQQAHQQGHEVAIITATNRFITQPIAELFNVKHLIATELIIEGNSVLGALNETPCFREGKLKHLKRWLKNHGKEFDTVYAFSDSRNDVPLLEFSDFPHAVNPDNTLKNIANDRGWPILDWQIR